MCTDISELVTLDDLAASIIEYSNAADDQLIKAAKLMQQAKTLIEAGEGNGLSWQDWVDQNIQLKRSRVYELLRLAKAEDPGAELERLREENCERQARYQARKKANPLNNGFKSAVISASLPAETIPAIEAPAAAVGEMVTAIAPVEAGAAEAVTSEESDVAGAAFEAWVARLAAWGQSASPEALAQAVALLDEHLCAVVAA